MIDILYWFSHVLIDVFVYILALLVPPWVVLISIFMKIYPYFLLCVELHARVRTLVQPVQSSADDPCHFILRQVVVDELRVFHQVNYFRPRPVPVRQSPFKFINTPPHLSPDLKSSRRMVYLQLKVHVVLVSRAKLTATSLPQAQPHSPSRLQEWI